MKIEVVETPESQLIDFFSQRIEEFNLHHWELKKKSPIAVKVSDQSGNIVAGAAGKTFGLWLLIDNLWVEEKQRGQDLGTKVLLALENAASKRGCLHVLLDTLNFQAKPFYEKHGYKVEWVQRNYPRDGHKYFMTKDL